MTNPFLLTSRRQLPLLGKTHCADQAGRPLVVYRGEHGDTQGPGFHSRLPSLSFGSISAANCYAIDPNNRSDTPVAPRVYPVYLDIQNPVVNDIHDPFLDLSLVEQRLGRAEAERIAREHEGHISNTNNWYEITEEYGVDSVDELIAHHPQALGDLYLDVYPVLDDPEFIRQARLAGYDGAVHCGAGETATEAEYRVFSPEQVVSAITGKADFGIGNKVEASLLQERRKGVESQERELTFD